MTAPSLRSPTLHLTIAATIILFGMLLGASIAFRLEVIARGQGRIVPVDRVQVIQPEYSGRITAIPVRDGDRVTRDAALMRLDDTAPRARLATVVAEEERLLAEKARLEAMVRVIEEPVRPVDLARPTQVVDALAWEEEARVLAAEADAYRSSLERLDAQEAALSRGEDVARAAVDRIDALLAIEAERLETTRRLFDQGTASRAVLLNAEQVFAELTADRDVQMRELARRTAEREALPADRRALRDDRRASLATRRAEIQARLAVLVQERRTVEREMTSTVLRAPMDGTVDGLVTFTIGGVAEAGQEVMRIVPSDGAVEIEAVLPNLDIGFVRVGQPANVRVDAYPAERFGVLRGEVRDVAADATRQDDGSWGYVLHVTPNAQVLQSGAEAFALRPGMTVSVDIVTGERRIISYFFAPIVRTIEEALGER